MNNTAPAIHATLDAIRQRRSVNIMFAVESGSRAWGFASQDSDYDVRFIYLSQLSEYLTISPRRDVIENDDIGDTEAILDFSGWDFRKFLGLVAKSNPICFEWLQSKIIYGECVSWKEVRDKAAPFFSPRAAMHHYLSMARHNYREHMRDGQSPSVKLKKYLYICLPLLCGRVIEKYPDGGPPPMPFAEAMELADVGRPLEEALDELIARKASGEELDEGPAVPLINRFIDIELWRLRTIADSLPVGQGKVSDLDDLFYSILNS